MEKNNLEKGKESELFEKQVHLYGRVTGTIVFFTVILFCTYMSFKFGVFPKLEYILQPIITMVLIMTSFFIGEMIAFPPILGPGSLYISYITGNVTTMKMPCAISALKMAGIPTGTEKGNAVAIVAVGTSNLVSVAIVSLGILFIVPLTPFLTSPTVQPFFNNVVPALFGALGGAWMIDNWKFSISPLIVAFLGLIVFGIKTQWVLLTCIIVSICAGRYLYKKSLTKELN